MFQFGPFHWERQYPTRNVQQYAVSVFTGNVGVMPGLGKRLKAEFSSDGITLDPGVETAISNEPIKELLNMAALKVEIRLDWA